MARRGATRGAVAARRRPFVALSAAGVLALFLHSFTVGPYPIRRGSRCREGDLGPSGS